MHGCVTRRDILFPPNPALGTPVYQKTEVKVARVFEFVDLSGCALHTITDPEDQLPIPAYGQEVSIGPIRMWVVSVVLSSIGPQTYRVRVRTEERE